MSIPWTCQRCPALWSAPSADASRRQEQVPLGDRVHQAAGTDDPPQHIAVDGISGIQAIASSMRVIRAAEGTGPDRFVVQP